MQILTVKAPIRSAPHFLYNQWYNILKWFENWKTTVNGKVAIQVLNHLWVCRLDMEMICEVQALQSSAENTLTWLKRASSIFFLLHFLGKNRWWFPNKLVLECFFSGLRPSSREGLKMTPVTHGKIGQVCDLAYFNGWLSRHMGKMENVQAGFLLFVGGGQLSHRFFTCTW